MNWRIVVLIVAAGVGVLGLAGVLAQPADAPTGGPTAVPIRLAAAPNAALTEVAAFAWDTADGWDLSGLPEDKPVTYKAVTDKSLVHQGAGAVEFDFNADIAPLGMKYFHVSGIAGSDGLAFWVLGDGSGAAVQVRLSQSDWSAWDSPLLRLDYRGWRRFVILRDECNFQDWGRNGPKWNDIKIFAFRISGVTSRCVIDDLRFYKGTEALKVTPVPSAPPIALRIDATKESAGHPGDAPGRGLRADQLERQRRRRGPSAGAVELFRSPGPGWCGSGRTARR